MVWLVFPVCLLLDQNCKNRLGATTGLCYSARYYPGMCPYNFSCEYLLKIPKNTALGRLLTHTRFGGTKSTMETHNSTMVIVTPDHLSFPHSSNPPQKSPQPVTKCLLQCSTQ